MDDLKLVTMADEPEVVGVGGGGREGKLNGYDQAEFGVIYWNHQIVFHPSYVWEQTGVSAIYADFFQRQRVCLSETVLLDSLGSLTLYHSHTMRTRNQLERPSNGIHIFDCMT